MAYNEDLVWRIRESLSSRTDVVEKKMFGGVAFMVSGNMCCGVNGDDIMVRMGADGYDEAIAQPHARNMDFTGRPMKGYVFVGLEGLESDHVLKAWVQRGLDFVTTLPPK